MPRIRWMRLNKRRKQLSRVSPLAILSAFLSQFLWPSFLTSISQCLEYPPAGYPGMSPLSFSAINLRFTTTPYILMDSILFSTCLLVFDLLRVLSHLVSPCFRLSYRTPTQNYYRHSNCYDIVQHPHHPPISPPLFHTRSTVSMLYYDCTCTMQNVSFSADSDEDGSNI